MRKQLLILLCGAGLAALGCNDPAVKQEMDKAAAEMKEAGHESAEAARHAATAAEAAGKEAAEDVKQEVGKAKESINGSAPATSPDGK